MNRLIPGAFAAASAFCASSTPAVALPDPAIDVPLSKSSGTAVLAGGCFWGMDGVFKHVKGVTRVVAGYAGGKADTARYELVSSGQTGHAESVRITYDPARIRYGQLLKVFFPSRMIRRNSTARARTAARNIARRSSTSTPNRSGWRWPISPNYRQRTCFPSPSSPRSRP